MDKLKCLELYSGIGGMHFSLEKAFSENGGKLANYSGFEVIAAIDINTVANAVYQENFGLKVLNRQIQSLSVKELSSDLSSSFVSMSPPCQPFTRQGKQLGEDDPRTASFLHLLKVLPELGDHKPKFIFLENVKGFERTTVCDAFLDCLERCGMVYLQCLLSPNQFNVPNSRLRYYCMAIEKSLCDNDLFGIDRHRIVEDPSIMGLAEELKSTVGDYLDEEAAIDDRLLLDEITLAKNAMVLDIVHATSRNSCCFTKNYGRYMKGTGSVLATCSRAEIDAAYGAEDGDRIARIRALNLRLFSPREVASLMCFPPSFRFPATSTLRESYHLLGNSVNVHVISLLMSYMFRSITKTNLNK